MDKDLIDRIVLALLAALGAMWMLAIIALVITAIIWLWRRMTDGD